MTEVEVSCRVQGTHSVVKTSEYEEESERGLGKVVVIWIMKDLMGCPPRISIYP